MFLRERDAAKQPSSPLSRPSPAPPTPSPSVALQQTPLSDAIDGISHAESWVDGVPRVEGLNIGEEEEVPQSRHSECDEAAAYSDGDEDEVDDEESADSGDSFDESNLSTDDKLRLLSERFRAMRTIDLLFYRALAAKILKKVVRRDVPRGESFVFRHMDAPLSDRIYALFMPLGYKTYEKFSVLADRVTNLRNNDVHFNKDFDATVSEAKRNFPIIFADVLKKPRYKIINDIFKLYDNLKLLFKN